MPQFSYESVFSSRDELTKKEEGATGKEQGEVRHGLQTTNFRLKGLGHAIFGLLGNFSTDQIVIELTKMSNNSSKL